MAEQSIINSMTGFGRAKGHCDGWELSVEMRSVNHRYCDIRLRLPQELAHHEVALRKQLQGDIGRGRVDITVLLSKDGAGSEMPQLQTEVAARYIALHHEVNEMMGSEASTLSAEALMQLPGVLVLGQDALPEEKRLNEALEGTVSEATARLCEMRAKEGAELVEHLLTLLEGFEGSMAVVAARAPSIPQEHFAKLQERLAQYQLEQEIDEARLLQEVALFADRCDVTEEQARLKSHLQQFRSTLDGGGVVGRRLDFLCQELLRETNTIGSKNADATIGAELISMKAAIEKIREQVQNVE